MAASKPALSQQETRMAQVEVNNVSFKVPTDVNPRLYPNHHAGNDEMSYE